VTIAQNLDADFEYLHPKQLRRFVLGPFYSAGVTDNSDLISKILSKVRKDENAWLADLDHAGGLFQDRTPGQTRDCGVRNRRATSITSKPTIWRQRVRV
jgi:hypothetical protein